MFKVNQCRLRLTYEKKTNNTINKITLCQLFYSIMQQWQSFSLNTEMSLSDMHESIFMYSMTVHRLETTWNVFSCSDIRSKFNFNLTLFSRDNVQTRTVSNFCFTADFFLFVQQIAHTAVICNTGANENSPC